MRANPWGGGEGLLAGVRVWFSDGGVVGELNSCEVEGFDYAFGGADFGDDDDHYNADNSNDNEQTDDMVVESNNDDQEKNEASHGEKSLVLEPAPGQKIVAFFGRGHAEFGYCSEFGIMTVDRSVQLSPQIYDLPRTTASRMPVEDSDWDEHSDSNKDSEKW